MTVARGLPVRSLQTVGRFGRPSLDAPRSLSTAVAIGVGVVFLAISSWWLAHNQAMPYGDAAFHLGTAFEFHDAMSAGHWTEPLNWRLDVYPPLVPLVGALGIFIGGRTVAAPILAQNVVYVPLLAVACYRISRRSYGPMAGCLAVTFALGAPLLAEQFHVFMLDAPLTALVAGTVWLVLESERFERPWIAAGAGALAGVGLMSKQAFPLYVTGYILVVLARQGGWRNVRGLGAFLAAGAVVAMPWYVHHAGQLQRTLLDAGHEANVPLLAKPPLLSIGNVTWYFWALANGVLLTPLLVFAAIGVATGTVAIVRGRAKLDGTVELLAGLAFASAAITAMPHKDVRYAMPLLVFLAVLGTNWIPRLRTMQRTMAIAALVVAVVASTLGASFGAGPAFSGLLPGNWFAPRGQGVMPLDQFTIYTNHNYMVSGPQRNGDLLGLFDELRRAGVRELFAFRTQAPLEDVNFNRNGLVVFARIARLRITDKPPSSAVHNSRVATLIHVPALGRAAPCVFLPEDGGLWIRLGDPAARSAHDFCPRYTPRFYGP